MMRVSVISNESLQMKHFSLRRTLFQPYYASLRSSSAASRRPGMLGRGKSQLSFGKGANRITTLTR